MNPILPALLTAGIPTLAVLIAVLRNESALGTLAGSIITLERRITTLEQRIDGRFTALEQHLNARIETLDRDLRDWAKITMQHNTDIARLKDKTGLE